MNTYTRVPVTSKKREQADVKLIECRVQFINFGMVDTLNETFRATIVMKAKWYEKGRLTFYDPHLHWNPKILIENGQSIPTTNWTEISSYKLVNLEDSTQIVETRRIEGDFWERFELEDFPLDIQELSINIISLHGPKVVKLITDYERVSSIYPRAFFTFHEQQKFTLHSMVRISSVTSYDNQPAYKNNNFKKSSLSATVIISRKSSFFVINNLLISFLITVLSLTLFSDDPFNIGSRLSSVFTLLLTIFAFKIVLTTHLPTISYLTIIDKYQIMNIMYLTAVCIWFSIIKAIDFEHEVERRYLDNIMFLMFVLVLLFMNCLILYLLCRSYNKIRQLQREQNEYNSIVKNLPYTQIYGY